MSVSYDKLFRLLADRGVSNVELTQKCGFSANVVTRLKRNHYVSLESVEKICFALNCCVDEILEFIPEEKR